MSDWQQSNDPSGKLLLRAGLCELWGKRALAMSRDELLVFVGFLDELATARGPVDLATLTREQLEARRNELHVQLAAVNDRLHAMGATRNGDLAAGRFEAIAVTGGRYLRVRDMPDAWGTAPLDSSDPSA